MQTKRLTLDEYRKVNAVWLSNNKFNFPYKDDKEFIISMYTHYLSAYGINIQIFEAIRSNEELMKDETNASILIEQIISEHEAPLEHCHH